MRWFLLIGLSLAITPGLFARHKLNRNEQHVLKRWLTQHHDYRLATDADCECATEIEQIQKGYGGKWKPVSDYHPYVATGDFNNDGVPDFAVGLIDLSRSTNEFVVAVFNGPISDRGSAAPAFIKSGLNLQHQGFFFGPPRPKPYRLVVGPFESEGAILVPHGRTYILKPTDCC